MVSVGRLKRKREPKSTNTAKTNQNQLRLKKLPPCFLGSCRSRQNFAFRGMVVSYYRCCLMSLHLTKWWTKRPYAKSRRLLFMYPARLFLNVHLIRAGFLMRYYICLKR